MVRICNVKDLKGNELLARQILTKDLQVLLEKGERLQEHQIGRLKEFDIEEVYIVDETATREEQILILKEETQTKVKESMLEIIDKHSNGNPLIMKKVVEIAESVIEEVFQIEELSEKIYEIKEHDADLYEHASNVCSLSTLLAIRMDYPRNDLNDIAIGALLHDIGLENMEKFYVNTDIKTQDIELIGEYKKHPAYGFSSVEKEPWISDLVKNIILYHHERADGSGFPTRKEKIEDKIQIVQLCDQFDEMMNGIGYKKMKTYEILEHLKVNKGKKYSSKIVDVFMNFIASYPIGAIILTNEKEVGVVIRQNKQFPDRPVIKILKDKHGNVREGHFIKDLLQENTVFIEKQL